MLEVRARVTEVPAFFPAGEQTLFGVLTRPSSSARETGVILLTGGAFIPGTNRNRLSVRMARALAERGFPVLRFDYHGVGESTGEIGTYDLNRPFSEDLEGAADLMRGIGVKRLAFVGSCFGARTLLSTAERIPELSAAILMSAPIQDFAMGDEVPLKVAQEKSLTQLARMAFRPKTLRSIFAPPTPESGLRMRHIYKRTVAMKARLMFRGLRPGRGAEGGAGPRRAPMSENFSTAFRGVAQRGVALLFLYGDEEPFYKEFSRVRRGVFRPLFDQAKAVLDLDTVNGVLHGFSTLEVQDAAIERTLTWVDRVLSPIEAQIGRD